MKHNRKFQNTLMLLVFLGLMIPLMSSCAKEKKPRVQRGDAAEDTMTEDTNQSEVAVTTQTSSSSSSNSSGGQATAKKTSTAKSSANPFEGTWDVDVNGTFANWSFGYASKSQSGDKLEGKVTDGGGAVIGDYVVLPNKTVELNIYSSSTSLIVPYKVSNGGNQIIVDDGTTKVTLTKGKTNTTIQNDANVLASKTWSNVNNPSERIDFGGARKSGSGWNGTINYSPGGNSGTYSLTTGKLTTTVSGSVDTYTYKLRNGNSTLDLTDSSGNTETYN